MSDVLGKLLDDFLLCWKDDVGAVNEFVLVNERRLRLIVVEGNHGHSGKVVSELSFELS